MRTATLRKVQDAQPVGVYTPTLIDERNKAADFLLEQVNPYFIRWKTGDGQIVTARQLTNF